MFLKKMIFFPVLIQCFFLGAQGTKKMSRAEYLEKYKEYAIKEMERTGIPASITMAQGMLESGDGNSRLAVKGNNHFGIKCHNWNGGSIHHDDDKRNECFRKYNSAYESYRDHSDFLKTTPRYAFLFEYAAKDYKAWAYGLKKAGYATSPVYAEALIKIIEDNKLYLLDEGVEIKGEDIRVVKTENAEERTIFENNRVKYVVVKEGETLESIARDLKRIPKQLERYNDLFPGYELKAGQSLYIQPKRSKAEAGKNIHIVKEGETIYSISQMYAIKISAIYERNEMDENKGIVPGQKLRLRGKKIHRNAEVEKKKEERVIEEKPDKSTEKEPDLPVMENDNEEMIFELDPE